MFRDRIEEREVMISGSEALAAERPTAGRRVRVNFRGRVERPFLFGR